MEGRGGEGGGGEGKEIWPAVLGADMSVSGREEPTGQAVSTCYPSQRVVTQCAVSCARNTYTE